MTTPKKTLVVVGASLAGAKAAEGARAAGFDGRILLIGDEGHRPYERPPLSKAILRGEAGPNDARVHDTDFYETNEVELVVDKAETLDTVTRAVTLAGGATIGFDRLVLATGAAPRPLVAGGSDLPGVHYLRTVDDALELRSAIGAGTRVAVVGAGWIGSEVAASARQMGAEVVLIDPAPVPLQRVVGEEIGSIFRQLHADHGVALRLGTGVTQVRGHGRAEVVVLDDGSIEHADVVVVGVGVAPRTELARLAVGLRIGDGIVVDETLETTVEGVFAAGDVASAWHPHYQRHLRVEHWANALNQGLTAGKNSAGQAESYTRLPYFFSDQYDLGLEYVGHADAGDAVVIRGDAAAREFIAFWHRSGVVTAAMNVNVWDVVDELKSLIEARRPVEPERLADPGVALATLACSDLAASKNE